MDYPEMITRLPMADISFDGVEGWLLQGDDQQAVFMDIASIGEVPEHSHGAQFGVVLEGEMTLTIGGESRLYGKGDSYFIPSGVIHSAVFHSRVKVIDVFDEEARYQAKTG
jgi:quercetin dioxygenase-like cupin family protein